LIYVVTENINMPVLPLGLAYVAASLEAKGHEVEQIYLRPEETANLLHKITASFRPEAIGISLRNIDDQKLENTTLLLDPVRKAVRICKEFSNAPVILGGAGYSMFPESALSYLGADMGVKGEGEISFPLLLETLAGKEAGPVPGLCLAGKSLIKEEFNSGLDKLPLPIPDIHLKNHPGISRDALWMPFQTRRGCPMGCNYCSTSIIEGKMLRRFSPDRAIEALSRFVDAGYKQFFFVDNTFNMPPSYANDLCEGIIGAGLDIRFQAIFYPSFNPAKKGEELIEKMARAGCVHVSLGFESGSPDILSLMKKKFSPEEVRQVSGLLKKHGIKRMGFLMLGGPGETSETARKSLEFADSLALEAMKVTTGIRIYPGTELARRALEEGMITPRDDLLFPRFYLREELRGWLQVEVKRYMSARPNWTD